MGKDSFILYTEQKEVIDKLSDEQAGKLIKAIYEYVETDKLPKLDAILDIVIIPFKQNIDRNTDKWEKIKQKRSEAGKIGAEMKKQKQANKANDNLPKNDLTKEAINVNDNEFINDNVNDIFIEGNNTKNSVKASKHNYGEYKNVLLKDEELQSLKKEYPNWEEMIKYLDEYIEMKGYKAKSHYLCLKKWVADAVKKQISAVKNRTAMEEFLDE